LVPVNTAPLTFGLIELFDLPNALMILSLLFFPIVVTLSFLISNPSNGIEKVKLKKKPRRVHRLSTNDYKLSEMI